MSHFVNGNDIHTIDGAYAHLCDQGFSGQNLSLIADLWEKASQLTEAQGVIEELKKQRADWQVDYDNDIKYERSRAEEAEQKLEDVLAMLEYHSSGAESASFALEKIEQALKKEVE